jgi:DNA-binding CsgD family transcriptional regulator
MSELAPHLRRVLQIHARTDTLRILAEAGKIALNTLDTGVAAVDEEGHIVMANERAAAILEKGEGVASRRGKLTARYVTEALAMQRLIGSAARKGRGRGTGVGDAIIIHGDGDSSPTSVIVTPLPSSLVLGKGRACALVFLCDPAQKPASRAAVLRNLFRLTPAECRLAELLHSGMELRRAAESMGITAETARFMLKRVFSKTGAHRQSELVLLLSRLPGETSLEHAADS